MYLLYLNNGLKCDCKVNVLPARIIGLVVVAI